MGPDLTSASRLLVTSAIAAVAEVGREIGGLRPDGAVRAEVDTLGGLLMVKRDRPPTVAEGVLVSGRRLQVEQMAGWRVDVLRLLLGAAPVAELWSDGDSTSAA